MTLFISIIITLSIFVFYLLLKNKRKSKQVRGETSPCSLCEEIFSDDHLTQVQTLALCDRDFQYYNQNDWVEVKRVISDPSNPDESISIYNLKLKLLKKDIKSYILTEYIEEDGTIFSIFKLFIPSAKVNIYNSL